MISLTRQVYPGKNDELHLFTHGQPWIKMTTNEYTLKKILNHFHREGIPGISKPRLSPSRVMIGLFGNSKMAYDRSYHFPVILCSIMVTSCGFREVKGFAVRNR